MSKYLKKVTQLLNAIIATRLWLTRDSASREIKLAEKLLAKYHVARMAGKANVSDDKNKLSSQFSAAFNAYIVGTTSYTTSEATTRANDLHNKSEYRKRMIMSGFQLILNVIILIILGGTWKIPFIILATLLSMVSTKEECKMMTHMTNMMQAPNLLNLVLEAICTFTVYMNVIPDKLDDAFGMVYLLVSCFTMVF